VWNACQDSDELLTLFCTAAVVRSLVEAAAVALALHWAGYNWIVRVLCRPDAAELGWVVLRRMTACPEALGPYFPLPPSRFIHAPSPVCDRVSIVDPDG